VIILFVYDMLIFCEIACQCTANVRATLDTNLRPLVESCFRRPDIYAIVETGGKQYRVTPGQVVEVDFLDAIDGTTVELDRVLLIGDGDKVVTGKPAIEGAKVVATSDGDTRAKKVIAFRYKNKTRSHVKRGHHQTYTKLMIDKIVGPDGSQTEPAEKPKRRKKKEVTESGA